MAAGEYGDIWKAIATIIAAESAITSLLGSGNKGVYYSEESAPKEMDYPALRLSTVMATENAETSTTGDLTLRWQLDVFGVNTTQNWQIVRLLRDLLDVPRKRPQGISVAGWKILKNVYRDTHPVGGTGILVDGHEVRQLSIDFEMRAVSA